MHRHSYVCHGPGMTMQCSLIMAPGMMISPARLPLANDEVHGPLIESPKKKLAVASVVTVLQTCPRMGGRGSSMGTHQV